MRVLGTRGSVAGFIITIFVNDSIGGRTFGLV